MALPEDNAADAELRAEAAAAPSRGHSSSSSSSSSEAGMPSPREEAHERAGAATPPPTQQMDRHSSSSSSDGEAAPDPGRIPAEVFERDPAEANKDWSMMSTDSVFGLQVAPSSDFTGFFLAHPELMDIATPPRASTTNNADADATVLTPHFETIPEMPESAMKGNYSFAFPNLIDKRNSSKKVQDEQLPAAATEAVQAEPAPAEAAVAQTSSKPEAAPEKEAEKGGLFACFPCCS